jgi:hypothetical protein
LYLKKKYKLIKQPEEKTGIAMATTSVLQVQIKSEQIVQKPKKECTYMFQNYSGLGVNKRQGAEMERLNN